MAVKKYKILEDNGKYYTLVDKETLQQVVIKSDDLDDYLRSKNGKLTS